MTPREKIVKSAMDIVLSLMSNDEERHSIISRIQTQEQFLAILDLFYEEPSLSNDDRSTLLLACLAVSCHESFEFIFELSRAKEVSAGTKIELIVRELTEWADRADRQ